MRALVSALAAVVLFGCDAEPGDTSVNSAQEAAPKTVGYDLRRLRPVDGQPLPEVFDRMRASAKDDGKTLAILFSANWCERCRRLELELGNLHPPEQIEHMRVLELVEEEWEQVIRMDEFNALRQRWDTQDGTYPLFVVLDENGAKVEEMKEAVERLEKSGVEATLPHWFKELAPAS